MQKLLLSGFMLFWLPVSWAHPSLQVGDVLLQPLACWSCNLIEGEEETIYSHMGVVVSLEPLLVAEALGKVRALSLEEFNARTEQGQNLAILRLKDETRLNQLEEQSREFRQLFASEFEGKKYDHDFLWNNIDMNGEEKLYCSEFVAKLYQAFFGDIATPIKRMHFSKFPAEWERYFRGKPPVGEWGNSPGDFERSPLFDHIGEI